MQKNESSNLDHPCRETCSGWKQGFERGQSDIIKVHDENIKVLKEFQKLFKECDVKLTAADELLKEVMECMKGPIIKTGILVKIKTYLNGR